MHIFKTTGTDTLTVTQGGEVEVLVVAGGGAGGQWNAGGGGGGVSSLGSNPGKNGGSGIVIIRYQTPKGTLIWIY